MFSASLKQKLQDIRSLSTVDLAVPEFFARNLVFAYHVMIASENLLRVAVEKSEGSLKAYFIEHLEEEQSHEKWLAEDLLSLGIDAAKTTPTREAVQAAGSVYWAIYHVSPVALLGYMAALEFIPVTLDNVELLETLHGKDSMRCMRFHAEHDIEHGSDLAAIIEALGDDDKKVVLRTAVETALYLQSAISSFN